MDNNRSSNRGIMICPADSQYYWGNDEDGTCTSHVIRNTPRSVITTIQALGGNLTWCTRKKNHKGLHHCHNANHDCIRTWTTTEAVIEAL